MPTNLTARGVARLKPQARRFDVWDTVVPGLGLRVTPNRVKTWTLRYRIGRKLRRWTIGTYPHPFSLADARKAAKDGLKQVAKGEDPALAKHERRETDTVGGFAKTYIDEYAKPRKRSWKIDKMRLDIDVLPHWRHRLMRDITRRDVRELLDGIAKRPAPIVANRVRALLHKFFNVAIERDVVDVNPVTATARPGRERQRDRVLTEDEIRQLWAALDAQSTTMAAVSRLRLITAQRAREVCDMRWADIDLENAWWTIPGEHSKNGLPHRVPLSRAALDILEKLRTQREAETAAHPRRKVPVFVLAGARGKRQQSEAAKTIRIENFRGHDLRRTAASYMTSAGVSRLVVSKVLNHVERGVTAVYDRHSYDAEKRVALDTWARKLTAILEATAGAAVLPFTKGAR